MLRLSVTLAIVTFIYVHSPHREDRGLELGSVAGRLASALPRPEAAEAALASAILRGALDEGASRAGIVADRSDRPAKP